MIKLVILKQTSVPIARNIKMTQSKWTLKRNTLIEEFIACFFKLKQALHDFLTLVLKITQDILSYLQCRRFIEVEGKSIMVFQLCSTHFVRHSTNHCSEAK